MQSSNDTEIEQARQEAEAEGPPIDQRAEAVEEHSRLKAVSVYEIIQREGSGELVRGLPALWWSGLAAGIAIGFSVLAEAMLAAYLPDLEWKPLVANLGYSVGFLIVILGRQQLFTENTLTAVLPVVRRWKFGWFLALLRLWSIVLAANLVGCLLFALFFACGGVLSDKIDQGVIEIGRHLMTNAPSEMLLKGIVAGWLIAALVWMLPSAEGSEFIVITLMTYLIALGDFTHVIAGSAEVFYLLAKDFVTPQDAVFRFFLPTLIGNILGGTVLFGLLSYAQVRDELNPA
jgi:formate/nitrite transporter FocA (FNT family)